jgi:hypothetical protein
MAVLKNKTQGNYTIVSQNIMRDRTLSLAERGLLLTLLSLPDKWNFTIAGLNQILPDGREKIARILNSLIAKGYVTRIQSRGFKGQFDSTDLEVHETPVRPSNPPGNPTGEDDETQEISGISPFPENPYTVNRDTENPLTENRSQYITNKSNIYKSNNNKECKADTLNDSDYEKLVSEFGKVSVDYTIQRIKNCGYQGCCNYETIYKWCLEKKNRKTTYSVSPVKKNSFCDYPQRTDYDFEAIEQQLLSS